MLVQQGKKKKINDTRFDLQLLANKKNVKDSSFSKNSHKNREQEYLRTLMQIKYLAKSYD